MIKLKKIVPDPQVAPIIKKAFELFARGVYTVKDNSDFLFNNGIKSKNGKKIHISRVKAILTNPVYYDHFYWDGEIHEGVHEPIISKKLFDQVQKLFKCRLKPKNLESNLTYFKGLMRCGECGYQITSETHTKLYKTTNKKATYVYYRCSKKNPIQKCFQPYTRQKELIPQFREVIKKISLRPGRENPGFY